MVDEPEILEHHADLAPQARHVAPRRRGNFAVEQRYEPARGPLRQVHQLEQARFAGAAAAGEEMEGAGLQAERDVAQDLGTRAIPHADVLESNQAGAPPGRGLWMSARVA